MTPEERAEKILKLAKEFASLDSNWLREEIAAEIRAAVEEAVKSDSTMSLFIHKRLLREAVEEALADDLRAKCYCAVARTKWMNCCEGCGGIVPTSSNPTAEAYEDAAKIAEKSFLDWELFLVDHCGDANLIAERTFIADRIRARAAEVK